MGEIIEERARVGGGGEESGERGERKRWAVVMGIGRKWVEKDPGEGGRGAG